MKKILIASLLALSSFVAVAAEQPTVNPAFSKADEYIKAQNYTGAYQELDRLAKTGNPQAMYNLALLTQAGQGTAQNNAKALKLYEDSAKKGYPVSNLALGQAYLTGGLGVKPDTKKAKDYLQKASDQGMDDATVDLAVALFSEGTDKSNKEGLAKLAPLIAKDNYKAMHAKALYDLTQGIKNKNEASFKMGLQTIETLGKKGYIPALLAIANMYANGNIIQQNLPEAKKIFEALAKENVPQAKESLTAINKMIAEQPKAKS